MVERTAHQCGSTPERACRWSANGVMPVLSVATKKGASLAVESEPVVRLRSGRFDRSALRASLFL